MINYFLKKASKVLRSRVFIIIKNKYKALITKKLTLMFPLLLLFKKRGPSVLNNNKLLLSYHKEN